jgi:hypothetical protein
LAEAHRVAWGEQGRVRDGGVCFFFWWRRPPP